MYLSLVQYVQALDEYRTALQIQENVLPLDHPDIYLIAEQKHLCSIIRIIV